MVLARPLVLIAVASLLTVPALPAHTGDVAAAPAAAPAPAPEPGLYLLPPGASAPDGLVRLHMRMPDHVHQSGTAGMLLLGGFKKGHIHETFADARAGVRVAAAGPLDFYFVLAENAGQTPSPQDPLAAMAAMNSVLGDAPPWNATDADQFQLVHLAVSGDTRKVETGTVGGFRGASGKSPDAVGVKVEKIDAHEFHVRTTQPLAPGEYGFYFAGQGPGSQLWDFGVDPG